MNPTRRPVQRPTRALLMLLAALACSAALAAGKAAALDPKVRYQRESAACSSIRLLDDRANCLSDASARFANNQPTPATEQADVLKRNALLRCEALPEQDRKDCLARMHGKGTTSGTVAGGGIYRELVTREVGAVPAAAQPEAATPPAPTKR